MRPDRSPAPAHGMAAARGLLVAACLCLGACATRPGHFYQDDGPPDHVPAGLAETPDAVPRVEPLNPRANRPYSALGRSYTPDTGDAPFEQRGMASWYGRQYHGNPTASGEPYDMFAMSAAHPTLAIPSYARVTRVSDGRSVIVRINDRGPFLQDRVIDLSYAAAARLGIVGPGSGEVVVQKITARDIAAGTYGARPASGLASAARAPAPAPAAPLIATEQAISTRVVAAAPVAPSAALPALAAPGAGAPPPPAAGDAAPPPAGAAPTVVAESKGVEPVAVAAAPAPSVPAAPASDGTAAAQTAAAPAPPPAPLLASADVAPAAPAAVTAVPEAVPPAPAAAPPEAAPDADAAPPPAGKWAVQLGAFAVLAHAEALRDQMTTLLARPEAEDLPAASRHPRIEFDGRLHRVLVGGFDARAAALRGARALQRYLARDTTLYQH